MPTMTIGLWCDKKLFPEMLRKSLYTILLTREELYEGNGVGQHEQGDREVRRQQYL